MSPLSANAIKSSKDPSFDNNPTTDAGAQNRCKHHITTGAGAVRRFRHREAAGIVLKPNRLH